MCPKETSAQEALLFNFNMARARFQSLTKQTNVVCSGCDHSVACVGGVREQSLKDMAG